MLSQSTLSCLGLVLFLLPGHLLIEPQIKRNLPTKNHQPNLPIVQQSNLLKVAL